MPALIDWLNDNSSAVTASAAIVGALVTAIYSFFTILLWRATRQQADITRRIFEASHRPYLVLEVQEPADTDVRGRLSFRIVVTNRGTVPCNITGWRVEAGLLHLDSGEGVISLGENVVAQTDPIQTPVGRSLAPNEAGAVDVHFAHPGLPNPPLPFRLRGHVEYQGVAPWTYRTEFDAERTGESWKKQGHRIR